MTPPRNWKFATLGDACKIVSGATPKTGVSENWGGDVIWITPDDLSKDRSQFIKRGARSLSAKGYSSCSARIFPAGSVVYSSRAPIGYIAIADAPMCTNQGCKTAVPPPDIEPRYLYWYLNWKTPDIRARASGTTFKEISAKRFAETELIWPDLGEQRRIVDLLEDHLSRLDASGSGLEHAARRIDILEAQTIRAALTGQAVAGPHDVQIRAADLDDGELATLPRGWRWMRLGEFADVVGGVTKDSNKQSDPGFIEVPYLRVANVQRGHLNLKTITNICVSPKKAEALRLLPGDVLLNEGGDRDKLGRGWVWEGQIENCIHQNHVFRARIRDGRIDPYLLSLAANSIGGRWCERNGKQSVNLASISLSKIRLMPVPVPPHSEQAALRQQIESVVDGCRIMRSEITNSRTRSVALRRSLLEAAFSGRLTGSTPDIETAEEMVGV